MSVLIIFKFKYRDNADRYKLQENFIPVNGQGIKTLRINFHSVQNSTQFGNKGNFENTTADLNFLNLIVSKVNSLFANVSPPLNPQTCVCGSNCSIPDTRIRVALQDVYFDYSPSLYGSSGIPGAIALLNTLGQNTDKELNVFFNEDNGDSPGGFANFPKYDDLNFDGYVVVSNYNYTYENGQNNLDWAAVVLANNLYHEIGHVLGLRHTYSVTCCAETMLQSNFDYLDDFFGGTNSCPQLPMPAANWCNVGPNDDCSKNWMGAYGAQNSREATPKQLGRVHRSSMLSSARKYFIPNTSYIQDHLVSSNEIWDFNIRMYGNIRVKSGASLTIRCKVNMPPGSKIIVEENAQLIIEGGTITNIENKTWQGIELEGDNTKTQYPENGIYYHGRLITMDDAKIENAIVGINANGGGIVEATNTQFLNNEIDAQFLIYTNKFPTYAGSMAGMPAPNMSFFTECDFHTTKVLNTSSGHPDKHIYLQFVDGIKVRKSNFKNVLYTPNIDMLDRGYGIYSEESSFSVKGTCDGLILLGSPCYDYNFNLFDGLAYGVYATSANPMHTADVDHCVFNKNWRGVYINGMDHSSVKNSVFHINNPSGLLINQKPDDYNYGIYIRDALGFTIENNELDTQTEANFGLYTISTNNGNESSESIYRNIFTGINYAAVAHGKNDGLLYRCNEFYNTQSIGILVASYNSSIANPQGTCTDNTTPASNYFDHSPCGLGGYDMANSANQYSFIYNTHASPSNYAPNCINNVYVNTCNTVYDASACPDNQSFYFTVDKLQKIIKDEEAHEVIQNGLISNAQTIDNANKSFLLDEINNQQNATNLFNTLEAVSPYLSDDVLNEMLTTQNVLGEEEKTEILVANSSLTDNVMNTLNTLEPRFTEGNMSIINSAQGPKSERSILEDQILSMRRDLELLTSSIVRQYMALDVDLEEEFVWQDSAIDILNAVSSSDMQGLYSNVQVKLAQMYMSKGDLSTADQILASYESTVDNNYQSNIMRLAIAQEQIGETLLDVTGSDLSALENWSQDVDKKGYASAAGIFASINGETFLEEFAIINVGDEEGKGSELTKTLDKSSNFKLFPNPSNGLISIFYEGTLDANETLKVYNLSGQLMEEFKLMESSKQISLNHLNDGIYLVRYRDQLKKIVIQK